MPVTLSEEQSLFGEKEAFRSKHLTFLLLHSNIVSSETPIQQHLSTTGGRFMLKESQLLFLHFRAIEGADNTGNVLPTKPSPPSLCSGFCDLIVAPHIILLLGGKCLYEERGSEQHNAWDCICLCVSTRRGFKVTYGRKVRHI